MARYRGKEPRSGHELLVRRRPPRRDRARQALPPRAGGRARVPRARRSRRRRRLRVFPRLHRRPPDPGGPLAHVRGVRVQARGELVTLKTSIAELGDPRGGDDFRRAAPPPLRTPRLPPPPPARSPRLPPPPPRSAISRPRPAAPRRWRRLPAARSRGARRRSRMTWRAHRLCTATIARGSRRRSRRSSRRAAGTTATSSARWPRRRRCRRISNSRANASPRGRRPRRRTSRARARKRRRVARKAERQGWTSTASIPPTCREPRDLKTPEARRSARRRLPRLLPFPRGGGGSRVLCRSRGGFGGGGAGGGAGRGGGDAPPRDVRARVTRSSSASRARRRRRTRRVRRLPRRWTARRWLAPARRARSPREEGRHRAQAAFVFSARR